MTTTTIDFYNMLVKAGFEKAEAKALADEILLKREARETLATKTDLSKLKVELIQWMVGLMFASLLATAGLIAALVPLVT